MGEIVLKDWAIVISTYLVNKYGEGNTKTEFSGQQVVIQ